MTIEEINRTLQTVVESQANHESRMTLLEDSFKESFQQVALAINQLTLLSTTTDERLDSVEKSQAHTDSRLERITLLEDLFKESFQQVTLAINQLTLLSTTTDERLDSVEESQAHTDSRLDALINSQIQLTQHFDQMIERFDQKRSEGTQEPES